MATMSQIVKPILTLTDEARTKVLEVRKGETDPSSLALWVEVSGEQDGSYTYTMELRPISIANSDDLIQSHDDLSVVIANGSIEKISGATLDFGAAGMVMQNPNQPEPAPAFVDRPEADLSGSVAQMVIAVLEEEINPSIAAHGGHADLVAVEEDVAYLRLSGGCQGCGMAAVTLSQGIEVAIFEGVPEIKHVVDVTDHASGNNPYFEAAKK